jgi:hypothetical protein
LPFKQASVAAAVEDHETKEVVQDVALVTLAKNGDVAAGE